MNKSIVSIAVGTAFAATAVLAPIAHASENPFSGVKLSNGYQVAQANTAAPAAEKKKDGKCSEAKCAAHKSEKKADGKCSADKKADGKCSAEKKAEGKCSADKKKDGKCSADKK